MSDKHISRSIAKPLVEALRTVYWYKDDLKAFLRDTLSVNHPALRHLDLKQYKWQMADTAVRFLLDNQSKYFDDLLRLLLTVDDITDPGWLKSTQDGEKHYQDAIQALETLHTNVAPYRALKTDAEQARERQEKARRDEERRKSYQSGLQGLKDEFHEISQLAAQARGYALEKLLTKTFDFFDIEARGSFRITGEQIDGAFTLDGTEFLLEAKWQKELAALSDIHAFSGKIDFKLDNTLGLFVSIDGFQPNAIEKLNGAGRSRIILMTGADLAAVYDAHIPLKDLLTRKKQHAAQTGEVNLNAWSIIYQDS
ncbi:restriction endonuclease [Glutamicibacter sp. X7]